VSSLAHHCLLQKQHLLHQVQHVYGSQYCLGHGYFHRKHHPKYHKMSVQVMGGDFQQVAEDRHVPVGPNTGYQTLYLKR
jgi:hypothetical protein